jgi:hypothetical protein
VVNAAAALVLGASCIAGFTPSGSARPGGSDTSTGDERRRRLLTPFIKTRAKPRKRGCSSAIRRVVAANSARRAGAGYVFNIKFLPLRGEGMTFFLQNVVPFLNLGLAGFVLASVAARFIFPGVSLEGRTFWLLRSSPMSMRELLWSKFWVGTLPLLVLAIGIVGVTDVLLQVTPFMMIVSIGTITFVTLAVAGLALGFGTMFPQFETENAAQIPTSFGGLVFMMSSIALIGLVIVLEARPVYSISAPRRSASRVSPWR